MKRAFSAMLATVVVGGGVIVATTTPAYAACDNTGTFISIINKKTTWKRTNVHSDWAQPGINIRYSKTKEATFKAEGTATIGADAGVVFAKANVSFSGTLGKSWSQSDSWSYSGTVQRKPGKTKGRLMMFHEAKSFTAHKYRVTNGTGGQCKSTTVYKKAGTYPVKKNVNTWGIEYS
ncbi:hypothetical protein ACIQMR_05415 [Streptomyces sp. NPDC091376]|uniref:hypothetical protein n=1 Tax=Streptomyces sp. NPDC091376 TaxID=3365994 RepID=UPI0037F496C0